MTFLTKRHSFFAIATAMVGGLVLILVNKISPHGLSIYVPYLLMTLATVLHFQKEPLTRFVDRFFVVFVSFLGATAISVTFLLYELRAVNVPAWSRALPLLAVLFITSLASAFIALLTRVRPAR